MKLLRASRLAVLGTLLLSAASVTAQSVYVVGPVAGPGVDFTDLQAAIDAAADGDVLIATAGAVGEVVQIVNKTLVVAGVEDGGDVPHIRSLAVLDLEAGKSVIVRGVHIENPLGLAPLLVSDCEGAVLIEDFRLDGGLDFFNLMPAPTIARSSHVALTRCTIEGADAGGSAMLTAGCPGLVVEDSTVALYDCKVTGGHGADGSFIGSILLSGSSVGGQGLQLWSGTLLVSGSEIGGGRGGHGSQPDSGPGCVSPQKGGAGLRTFGLVRRLDSTITGGAPGFFFPCGTPATPGADIVFLPGGSVVTIPEAARSLEIGSPIENGGACAVTAQGLPGDNVVLLLSFAPLASLHAGLKGMLAGQPPYLAFPLGAVGIGGTLAFNVHVPADALPVGVSALTFINQFVVGAASGGGLLSSPSAVVLVPELP